MRAEVERFSKDADKTGENSALSVDAAEVVARAESFSRLRGLREIDEGLLQHFVGRFIHSKRAYSHPPTGLIFTTVHGAKNREFDHVFVVWGYKLQSSFELQRRLLYNAVTRAKTSCMVLDTRTLEIVQNDPLMKLLGDPAPPYKKEKKAAIRT
jgi:superfamily I DNA/RNA helicase